MARQDLVERGAEAHDPPALIERGHFERQNGVIARPVHRGARRYHGFIHGAAARAFAGVFPLAADCRHQAKMPFWACNRFSASSNTTDCGPSITSSVTSSPRCAGRQCMNNAFGLASDMSRALT